MQKDAIEIELSVGDVLQIGDHIVTIVDIDGQEVSFRIDDRGESPIEIEAMGSTVSWPK